MPASGLQLSLGVRETAAGGGADVGIGGNAGSAGGIEFVDLDAKTILFDGLWHAYTWNRSTATYTAFAGTTANSVLDGNYGSIEHLRFRNNTGISGPFTIWIDYVVNTVNSGPVVIQSFEGFADGTEVIFQEPSFSGSTSGNIAPGSSSGVDNSQGFDGTASYKVNWSFVDGGDRWVRLTTFGAQHPDPADPLRPEQSGHRIYDGRRTRAGQRGRVAPGRGHDAAAPPPVIKLLGGVGAEASPWRLLEGRWDETVGRLFSQR